MRELLSKEQAKRKRRLHNQHCDLEAVVNFRVRLCVLHRKVCGASAGPEKEVNSPT